jgi:hypothetical protein
MFLKINGGLLVDIDYFGKQDIRLGVIQGRKDNKRSTTVTPAANTPVWLFDYGPDYDPNNTRDHVKIVYLKADYATDCIRAALKQSETDGQPLWLVIVDHGVKPDGQLDGDGRAALVIGSKEVANSVNTIFWGLLNKQSTDSIEISSAKVQVMQTVQRPAACRPPKTPGAPA